MQIALYHNLPSGGAKRAVFETVKRLAQRHIIDVYTLSTANHDFCNLRPVAHRHYIFDFQPSRLFQSPWGRLNQFRRWYDLKRLEELGQKIAGEIDRHHYDLVYVQPDMWVQAPTVLNYLQTSTIYYIQESLRLVYEPAIPRPYLKKSWPEHLDKIDPLISLYFNKLIKLDRRNALRATWLLANSHFTATNIHSIYGRPAEVTYLGVDGSTFRPLKRIPKENFILSVGELRPNKGYDFLIETIARIPEARRPPLHLIGNASYQPEHDYLVNLARESGVTLTIEIMVDLETLVRRYNQTALFAYAPVREPLGLVALEAMACGTPVVGVAEGGVCETVVDGLTGCLVERDAAKFAEAILTFLNNPSLSARYGQQARQYVLAKWNWDRSVDQLEQYLMRPVGDTIVPVTL